MQPRGKSTEDSPPSHGWLKSAAVRGHMAVPGGDGHVLFRLGSTLVLTRWSVRYIYVPALARMYFAGMLSLLAPA